MLGFAQRLNFGLRGRWAKATSNWLPSNMRREVKLKAKEQGAMRISQEDHDFMMGQARIRTVLEYTGDYVYGTVLEADKGNYVDGERAES